jgi:TonB-linked SusC/RagA family outer membrane protein
MMKKIYLLSSLMLLLLAFASTAVFAQAPLTVRGVVSDETGAPLAGVSVTTSSGGVVTDPLGEYSIAVAADGELQFTYLGYATQTIPVNGRTTIDVGMLPDSQVMDDVIVIGYGTTTRRRATVAVDQVKASQIENRSVANMAQALQGTAPSLVIQTRNFNPNNQNNNINIRGIGTMGSNQPLLVVDGMIQDGLDAMSQINSADIESVSILKDAGSAAIYGSRAGNGVILLNTKRGRRNQAPVVKFGAMLGVQDPHRLWEQVEGYQNMVLKNTALANAGMAPEFTQAQILDEYNKGSGPILYDDIIKPAMQQSYNASVSGGSEYTTYMISAGYFNQKSNFVGPGYGVERLNFRSNLDTEYKRFKFSANLAYTRQNNLSPYANEGNVFADVVRVPRYSTNLHTDPETGKYVINGTLRQFNSLGLLEAGGTYKQDNDIFSGNASLDLKIIEGLKLRGAMGADITSAHRYSRQYAVEFYDLADMSAAPAIDGTNRVSADWSEKKWIVNMQIMADFDRYFGKHHVHALIGGSNESYQRQAHQLHLNYSDPDLGIEGDGTIIDPLGSYVTPGSTTRRSISSIFGRAGYDFSDKYFIEGSFRYDGSSKFAPVDRWGFFPSVALSWRASEENFMEWWRYNMGELKLRATLGTLGNQDVADFQYYTTWQLYANNYGFNNVPVAGAGFSVASEKLQWESTRTWNIGLDASFFQNSLVVSFDYFIRNTSGILAPPLTPYIYGADASDQNLGGMQTKGWELVVNYNLQTGRVGHSFNFNIGDSQNKLTKFSYRNMNERLDRVEEFYFITREGLPYRSYYGFKTDGFIQTQAQADAHAQFVNLKLQPGDPNYIDRDGNGVLDNNDLYYLGNAFPRFTFGFTYGLDWKGLDFSLFLQGVMKRDMLVRGELVEPFHESYGFTMYKHQLDYWTPTNTDARWPRLAKGNFAYDKGDHGSDIFLQNGAYMRIKDIKLGYTLPTRWTEKIGMSKLRLYVNAQNPVTFSYVDFIDPESTEFDNKMSGSANSARNYPTLRYYGGGIDITF